MTATDNPAPTETDPAALTTPAARVLADSVSPAGVRVTTFELTYHRFIHAEILTHRVFSRNSSSSRAVPVSVQLERIERDPAMPLEWGRNQPGMQAAEELSPAEADQARAAWLAARDAALVAARALHALGVHKQVANRVLEPFSWLSVILTGVDFDGFAAQRISPLAQPEIRVLARALMTAREQSVPRQLEPGQWHTPLIQPDEDEAFWRAEAYRVQMGAPKGPDGLGLYRDAGVAATELRKRVAAARCARVSYLTHDGIRSLDADLDLYDKLITADPGHWSPLEHVCTPLAPGATQRGNLAGFLQLRHEVAPHS